MGPRVEEFERRFADHLGCAHVVATSSCTTALHLALLCAGVGPGDEVIVPSFTFVATVATVIQAGATPVFAEIGGQHDLCMDPDHAESLIGPRTKAILPVHYGGYAASPELLERLCGERGLVLLEDCAHAPFSEEGGRRLGTIGLAGALQLLSQQGARDRRGRRPEHGQRRGCVPGPAAALPGDDRRHPRPSPRARRRLRRHRPWLQLPHGRAPRGPSPLPLRPARRRDRSPPAPDPPLPRAPRPDRGYLGALQRRAGRALLRLLDERDARRAGPQGRGPHRAGRARGADDDDVHGRARVQRVPRALPGASRCPAPSLPPRPSSTCRSSRTSPRRSWSESPRPWTRCSDGLGGAAGRDRGDRRRRRLGARLPALGLADDGPADPGPRGGDRGDGRHQARDRSFQRDRRPPPGLPRPRPRPRRRGDRPLDDLRRQRPRAALRGGRRGALRLGLAARREPRSQPRSRRRSGRGRRR